MRFRLYKRVIAFFLFYFFFFFIHLTVISYKALFSKKQPFLNGSTEPSLLTRAFICATVKTPTAQQSRFTFFSNSANYIVSYTIPHIVLIILHQVSLYISYTTPLHYTYPYISMVFTILSHILTIFIFAIFSFTSFFIIQSILTSVKSNCLFKVIHILSLTHNILFDNMIALVSYNKINTCFYH